MSAKEVFEKYKIELNSRDFERLMPLISEECNFWHPTGTYQGMVQAREGFENIWEIIQNKKLNFLNHNGLPSVMALRFAFILFFILAW